MKILPLKNDDSVAIRHVALAREGFLPYPQRCLRTGDYIYIINFEPNRWPMGDPRGAWAEEK